jgi:hypothetical protein
MDENRARMTVMDRDRRMLQTHYTFIFTLKAIGFRVAERFTTLKLLIFNTTDATLFSSPFFSNSGLLFLRE